MGICASCLRGITGDEDNEHTQVDETSPLLNNERDYDKDAQLRQREEELNQIVNETNDNLIDISSFFNPNASLSELALKKSISTLKQEQQQQPQQLQTSQELDSNGDNSQTRAKLITSDNLSGEEKAALTEVQKSLSEMIKEDCKIKKKGPLVVEF